MRGASGKTTESIQAIIPIFIFYRIMPSVFLISFNRIINLGINKAYK